MLLMLEKLFGGREQSLMSSSYCDKAVTSECPDAELTSSEMTSSVSTPRDTARDYLSQIRQLRQQM